MWWIGAINTTALSLSEVRWYGAACVWLGTTGGLIRPQVEMMIRRVRLSKVIHTDDRRASIFEQHSH
jgi:hypothetical protein